MSMLDRLVNIVNEQGWLAISSLYFDNNMVIPVSTTSGNIAYSEADDCFYTYKPIDQGYTEIIEGKMIAYDKNHLGPQWALTCVGTEHMQHFDIAQYMHYDDIMDERLDAYPYPEVPKQSDVESMTKDEETGLYAGTDIATMKNMEQISTIGFFDKSLPIHYSGARVDYWKEFYENHQKFLDMLQSAYGISAI